MVYVFNSKIKKPFSSENLRENTICDPSATVWQQVDVRLAVC
jgi:hypothetical protein